MEITKEIWKEISNILTKHKISYTTHFEERKTSVTKSLSINNEAEYDTVQDKHIQINLVIPDFFEEGIK